jgi:putative membrane protein insertion efficiency factor
MLGSPRRRVLALTLTFAVLLPLGYDLSRKPQQQVSARILLGCIHAYQTHLSQRVGELGVVCRFRPTCSHYAEGAITKDGALIGSARAAWRVLRCGPWTPMGTVDPP